MKRNMWMAAIVCAASVGVAAQGGRTAASGKKTGAADTNITVTGCVQNEASPSSSAAASGGFVLSNAIVANAAGRVAPSPGSATGTTGTAGAAAKTAGTTGTAGSASKTHTGMSYVLDGRDSELKNHLGHQIEVTGTLEARNDAIASAGSTSSAPSATPTWSVNGAQHLRVTAVRMISAGCAAK